MSNLGNSGIFSGITAGLSSTYSLLANASSGNVTLESISAARTNNSYANNLNQSFASYIQTNFTSLDSDKDGKLTSAELSTLTSRMNTMGLTAAQLSQLGPASGLSGTMLEQVLTHFAQIDANGDGKVTSAEISGYKLQSAMEMKKTEFTNRAAANQSVFYGDSDAASKTDSSSILNYKYMNENKS